MSDIENEVKELHKSFTKWARCAGAFAIAFLGIIIVLGVQLIQEL